VWQTSRIMGHARLLEDKIRVLCAKAVAAKENADVSEIVSDLQNALRQHAQRVRKFAASAFTQPLGLQHDKRRIAK
jgi:hypothetical protein